MLALNVACVRLCSGKHYEWIAEHVRFGDNKGSPWQLSTKGACMRRSISCLYISLVVATLVGSLPSAATVLGSEFRSLLSDPFIGGYARGDSVRGNRIVMDYTYTNISTRSFVIDGIASVITADPEDIGITTNLPANATELLEQAYPSFDLFGNNAFGFVNPPRQQWVSTEVTFSEPFPILVIPGDTFSFRRTSISTTMGPNFGPLGVTAGNVYQYEEWRATGEALVAVDLNWSFVVVPEPGSIGLILIACAMSCWFVRR